MLTILIPSRWRAWYIEREKRERIDRWMKFEGLSREDAEASWEEIKGCVRVPDTLGVHVTDWAIIMAVVWSPIWIPAVILLLIWWYFG